jgi:hypothetical protein
MTRFPRALAAAIVLVAFTTTACQGANPTAAPTQAAGTNPAFAGQKTGTVKGRVTEDGVLAAAFRIFQVGGIANATVTCTSGGVTTEVKTDVNGNFAVEALQGTEAVITATHSDASGNVFREVTSVQVPTAAEPPIVDVASLVTRRTGSIQGLVELANGVSPEGVDVFVGGTTMIGKASEKGRFALANIPEGIWDIVVQKPGFGRAVIEDVAVQAGRPMVLSAPVVLAPEAAGATSGIKAAIRDGSGKAVVGATLSVYGPDGQSTTATSDGQGQVSVTNLPDGDYTVQVYRPFYQPAMGQTATVKDGQLTDLGEIKLQSTTMYFGQASGQVIDEYGDPVDGAVVMLDPPVTEQVFTDAQGRFTLDRIMPGEYTLHVAAGGMEVESHELRIDNAPNTKVTFEGAIFMRQTPPTGSDADTYRVMQARGRHADLVEPIVQSGLLNGSQVVLYWEPPTKAQYPEGIVSVHYEVEHLDDALGSPDGDDVDGDWKQVAAKADVSYEITNEDWEEDEFRVRAVGLDAAGEEYVSDWTEISLLKPDGDAAAGYQVLQQKIKTVSKAASGKYGKKLTPAQKRAKKKEAKKKRKDKRKKGVAERKKIRQEHRKGGPSLLQVKRKKREEQAQRAKEQRQKQREMEIKRKQQKKDQIKKK